MLVPVNPSIQRLAHAIKFGSLAELRQAGSEGAANCSGASETYYVHATDDAAALAYAARHFRRLLCLHEGYGSRPHEMPMTPRRTGDSSSAERRLLDAIEGGDGTAMVAAAAGVADRERALGLWG